MLEMNPIHFQGQVIIGSYGNSLGNMLDINKQSSVFLFEKNLACFAYDERMNPFKGKVTGKWGLIGMLCFALPLLIV